jgi:hypothetical protein
VPPPTVSFAPPVFRPCNLNSPANRASPRKKTRGHFPPWCNLARTISPPRPFMTATNEPKREACSQQSRCSSLLFLCPEPSGPRPHLGPHFGSHLRPHLRRPQPVPPQDLT